jgi:starch synthase
MTHLKLLSVASEIYPLVKTGGLGDVAGALPGALAAEDVTASSLVPGYPAVLEKLGKAETVQTFADLLGGPARLLGGSADGLDLFVLDAPHLYHRPGDPYRGPDREDWPDNALRFAALARVGADMGRGLVPGFVPDVVQAHDWQAGLVPALLHYTPGARPGTVMTVHNLAFQGLFPPDLLAATGLPPQSFTIDGVEFYGRIGYLKAGLQFADRVTTVSPTYGREILTPEAGMGLDGLLRARSAVLSGILNGIDDAVWNPADDFRIAAAYTGRTIQGRAWNKAALQNQLGLDPNPEALTFGVVSRLSPQKGLDLLLEALPALLRVGAQLALLGSGDADLERAFRSAQLAHPGRIACTIGYDETLAHLMQAGADALLIPSRFEPCGLTQLCALRYGAVPVVARVGGLADTIIDANEMAVAAGVATGIQFWPVNADGLVWAIRRTAELFADGASWRRMQVNGMGIDVSWGKPAHRYAALYRDIAAARVIRPCSDPRKIRMRAS